jgi:hypothetical protein
MYKKEIKPKFPMKLQFFAEGGEAGADAGADGGNGEGTDADSNEGAGSSSEGEAKTFDDILKDSKYQSEFDKKIAKALETAKGKWETDKQTEIENAKTEAQKLAKMNTDQKAEYEAQKKLADLAEREEKINSRELRAEALVTLGEKNLPKELADILNYKDAEQCKTSIASVEKAFQSAVEKAVNDKLRGNGSPKGSATDNNSLQAQIAKAVRGQA